MRRRRSREGYSMLTKTFSVDSPLGLHARPTSILVVHTAKLASQVTLRYGSAEANGKSVIGILALKVPPHGEVEVTIAGPDEEKGMARLERFFTEDIKTCG